MLVLLCSLFSASPAVWSSPENTIRTVLEAIASGSAPPTVGGEGLHAHEWVSNFYERRGYRPVWGLEDPRQSLAGEMLDSIERIDRHGLRPRDYHFEAIRRLVNAAGAARPSVDDIVIGEFLLSDAFILLASHLDAGRLSPVTIEPHWIPKNRELDFVSLLDEALQNREIAATIDRTSPTQSEYRALVARLELLRQVASQGGWQAVPAGPTLKPGQQDPRVTIIGAHLRHTEDLPVARPADSLIYDDSLVAAVRRYQQRHGLEADGVIGSATLATLNIPVGQRIDQIIANLERWRWLPADLGTEHLRVNIAGFYLTVMQAGQPRLSKRIIVGRDYRRTPIFSDNMSYLVFNPNWTVPPTILLKDKLPELRKNPKALAAQGYVAYAGWDAQMPPVAVDSIDWSQFQGTQIPYRLVQQSGPGNALGRIKFMFPNKFHVYLHDTPARELFARAERAFSSGCIRVEDPIELASYLLRNDPQWDKAAIDAVIASGAERTVKLKAPVPIHLLYWTVWVDQEDRIHFRKDIYSRDAAILSALRST